MKKGQIGFLVWVLSWCILPISPAMATGEWDDTGFFASYLNLELQDAPEDLYSEIGQKQLVSFRQIASEQDGVSVSYESMLELTFRMNLFTTYLPQHLLEDYYTQQDYSLTWLDFHVGADVNPYPWGDPIFDTSGDGAGLYQYAVNWNAYEITSAPIANVGKFGRLQLVPSIKNFRPEQIEISNELFTFQPTTIDATLETLDLTSVTYTPIGQYDDVFLGENSASFGVITDLSAEENWYDPALTKLSGALNFDSDEPELDTYINGNEAGVTQGPVQSSPLSRKDVMVRQTAPTELDVSLHPEIDRYHQDLTGTYVEVLWDQHGSEIIFDGTYDTQGWIAETHTEEIDETRDIGIHVQNYCAYLEFKVVYSFATSGKLVYLTTSDGDTLGLPQVTIDDMFWDLFLNGDVSGEYEYDPRSWWDFFLEDYKWQIRAIIGLLVIVGMFNFFGPQIIAMSGAVLREGQKNRRARRTDRR